MTPESPTILERLLRNDDLGWMIDMYTPKREAIPFLLDQLVHVESAYQNRFHYDVSFSPESLELEAGFNPHKIRGFLQALGASRNPDMLVMVWRILQGLSIREVTMNYREMASFSLRVTLATPGEEGEEIYLTDNIRDAALLRNFGIAGDANRPLFDGFYPLRNR